MSIMWAVDEYHQQTRTNSAQDKQGDTTTLQQPPNACQDTGSTQ